ncbi:MAG TPA: plasmid pRiA4b ORF-3 family protein [Microbacteriaceae bacterium]
MQRRFISWYEHHDGLDDAHLSTPAVSALVARLFAMVRELGHGRTLADPRHTTLTALLDAIDAEDDAFTLAGDAVDVLGHYLDFLDDTDSWNTSDEEFDASYAILDDIDTPESGVLRELMAALDEVPEVFPSDQLRAMNALPIVDGVDRFLAWVGSSRTLTSTGALRLVDIQPVAALIGLAAVGRKNAEVENEFEALLTGADQALHGDPATTKAPIEVGTMWDLPELAAWWVTLDDLSVIEITATTVRPGPAAAAWRSTDAPEHFTLRTAFLRLYVGSWWQRELESDDLLGPLAVINLIGQLAAAVSPHVLPELSTSALADIFSESTDFAGLGVGAVGAGRCAIALRHLYGTGILVKHVTADGAVRYAVPPELRPVVAEALIEAQTDLLEPEDDELDDELLDSPHPTGTLLQLKIALVDARPVVWRRILIEADATLGELHEAIQRSFQWNDSHLHRFTVDDWYSGGPTFGPVPDGVSSGVLGGAFDENLIELGALLREPADDLFYIYDFGDEWRHLIRLEELRPAGFADAPACTDGRGAAPDEDSGGPSGWAQQLRSDAVAARFDRDAVNARLAPLRRIR